MKHFGIFLLITFLGRDLFAQRYFNDKYSLKTEQSTVRDSALKELLITCEGTSGPRVFLETLSGKLIKSLEKSKVAATYIYTGSESSESSQRTEEALSGHGADAVLKFEQADESGNPIKVSQSAGLSLLMGGVVISRTTTLNQTFAVTLTSADAAKKIYWKGILKVNFDLSKSKLYNDLVKMVMAELYGVNCFSEKPGK